MPAIYRNRVVLFEIACRAGDCGDPHSLRSLFTNLGLDLGQSEGVKCIFVREAERCLPTLKNEIAPQIAYHGCSAALIHENCRLIERPSQKISIFFGGLWQQATVRLSTLRLILVVSRVDPEATKLFFTLRYNFP